MKSPFDVITLIAVALVFAIFAGMLLIIATNSIPAVLKFKLDLFFQNVWNASEDPEHERYGLLGVLWGSVYTSTLAILIAFFLSIGYAVFVVDYSPPFLKKLMVVISDIMAGLPTIIYGIWGCLVLVPILKTYVMQPLYDHLSFIPLFDYPPVGGYSYFAAGVLLGIMITPFTASMIREAYELVPFTYREAAVALGATDFEVFRILIGYVKPAVISALILGFGRAVGETVAVSLVIGNAFNLTYKLFAPGYTISSLIANQFGNAFIYEYMTPVLFAGGLLLFLIGLSVSAIGEKILQRWYRDVKI